LFICSSILGQSIENNLIRFDGLYQTVCDYEDEDDDEGEMSFLRFYPNGKVIGVGTECDATASDLKDWFNPEKEYVSVGNYVIKGRKLIFHTTSRVGRVNYKGRIKRNGSVKIKFKSLITGYNG